MSKDGQRHNIVKTAGLLNGFQITEDMAIEEICRVLPPTLFDRVITATANGVQHGSLRGGANVIGFTLQSMGTPTNVAYFLSKFIYYSGFFSIRFNMYLRNETVDAMSNYMSAMYQAAMDTGQ